MASAQLAPDRIGRQALRLKQDQGMVEQIGDLPGQLTGISILSRDNDLGGLLANLLADSIDPAIKQSGCVGALWALRGAGAANFGVATSFVFTTVPAPRAVNFHLAWGFDVAARVIEAWQGWAPSGPDELAASLKLTVSGDQNQRPTVNVYGTAQVSEADTSVLIDDLLRRIDADPTWRWVEDLPFAETRQLWARRRL